MPLKGEAKREYNRLRQRRLRGYLGKGTGEGVVPNVVPNVVPALRENVVPSTKVPSWVSEAPRPFSSKSAHGAFDLMRYLNERGLTLEWRTGEVLDLFPMVQERVEALERTLLATQQALAALQVDVAMQRAEAILDDRGRELLEEES